MTGDGFVPAEVKVKKGEPVRLELDLLTTARGAAAHIRGDVSSGLMKP